MCLSQKLFEELDAKINNADWLTIGVMAKCDVDAKFAMRAIIHKYSFKNFKDFDDLKAFGKVFLKGNQKSGEVYLRSEFNIGEGILLTCQYNDPTKDSLTYGPFPLNFFSEEV